MTAPDTVYVYRDNGPAATRAGEWRAQRIVRDSILDDELLAVGVHATTDEAIAAARVLWPHATVQRATWRAWSR